MSIVISGRIAEMLKRESGRHGLTPEEYLLEILTKDMDPGERAREYIEASHNLVEQAEKELEGGDLRQVSEKIWGACALAIKAHALAKKGLKLESHRDLWLYKNEIARELGEWVKTVFRQAGSMHKNFYEDLATREDVEDVLKEVKKLVTAIRNDIESPQQIL
ncbi:MAG: PaREP1 family protein [Sulfolobales archaeon]